jgi:hypothetical protein
MGFFLNGIVDAFLSGEANVFTFILTLAWFICYSLPFWTLKHLLKEITFFGKIRLSLLGVAIAFFVYAIYDLFSFNYGPGANVALFLSSIAIGSILSVFVRLFDIMERKEL